MSKYEIFLYGFIIALIVILIWLYYAYAYKTSMTRLSKLAGQRYMMLVSPEIQAQYIVQCDEKLSSYNKQDQTFNAVIKFTPDINHPKAQPIANVTKKYNVTFDNTSCDPNNLVQYISCINVNE